MICPPSNFHRTDTLVANAANFTYTIQDKPYIAPSSNYVIGIPSLALAPDIPNTPWHHVTCSTPNAVHDHPRMMVHGPYQSIATWHGRAGPHTLADVSAATFVWVFAAAPIHVSATTSIWTCIIMHPRGLYYFQESTCYHLHPYAQMYIHVTSLSIWRGSMNVCCKHVNTFDWSAPCLHAVARTCSMYKHVHQPDTGHALTPSIYILLQDDKTWDRIKCFFHALCEENEKTVLQMQPPVQIANAACRTLCKCSLPYNSLHQMKCLFNSSSSGGQSAWTTAACYTTLWTKWNAIFSFEGSGD